MRGLLNQTEGLWDENKTDFQDSFTFCATQYKLLGDYNRQIGTAYGFLKE